MQPRGYGYLVLAVGQVSGLHGLIAAPVGAQPSIWEKAILDAAHIPLQMTAMVAQDSHSSGVLVFMELGLPVDVEAERQAEADWQFVAQLRRRLDQVGIAPHADRWATLVAEPLGRALLTRAGWDVEHGRGRWDQAYDWIDRKR